MIKNKNTLYIVASLVLFIVISVGYFYPVLQDKGIIQPDIVHYKGGAKELEDFRNTYGYDTYWSNSMFGGMPTYLSGALFKYDIIKSLDSIIRFLPRPADYIFLLLGGFFLFGIVRLKNWKYALLGALFFAFSTYFFIVIGAGHNSKINTIGYFAPFFAGVYLLYRQKYLAGFIFSTLFLSLQISANHPQMTYYLFMGLLVFGVVELIYSIKQNKLKPFLSATGLFILSIVIALGMNTSRLLTTLEYTKYSTRGQSEMTLLNQGKTEGLDKEYITSWSYGVLETANLFIPNFMGGANQEKAFNTDNIQAQLRTISASPEEINKSLQLFQGSYWGEQPGTSGPAYQGAVVIFLAIIGLFIYKGREKYWLLGATILSFMMAWGRNFGVFTDFMIDYFPMYNKFRAPSSALVLAEFTIPILAMLGIYAFIEKEKREVSKKVLLNTILVISIVLVLLLLLGKAVLPFHSERENGMNKEILNLIVQERFRLFRLDVFRTLVLVLLTAGVLYAYVTDNLKAIYAIIIIGLLSIIDLWTVDTRYLNESNFTEKSLVDNPFPSEVSSFYQSTNPYITGIISMAPINNLLKAIKDNDPSHYRVYNLLLSPFNETNTSYFHQSIGGYHGAKLQKYQDVLDIYFNRNPLDEKNQKILDLLNVKYVITIDSTQNLKPQINNTNNGNAWFVNKVDFTKDANEEILKISDIDNKTEATANAKYQPQLEKVANTSASGQIALNDYRADRLAYTAETTEDKLAVFSEIYYKDGWIAKVDGQPTDIFEVDYLLRGIIIPKGKHTLEFTFEPKIVSTGRNITMLMYLLFIISIIGIAFAFKKRKNNA